MTFTSRTTGKTYPSTEFGALRAARDEWDVKARNRGHDPKWTRIASNTFEGICTRCGAGLTCGAAWSSSAGGPDLRTGACPGAAPRGDELTTVTHGPAGYTVTTGYGVAMADAVDRDAALFALFERGFTPQVAVAAVTVALVDGRVTVKGLPAT